MNEADIVKRKDNETAEEYLYRLEQQYGYGTHGVDYWAEYFRRIDNEHQQSNVFQQ